jgi:CBS domain-containing protein
MASTISEFDEAYDDPREPPALSGEILDQPIRTLNPREAVLVPSNASVAAAVALLNERKAGCVLVMEGEGLVGIFTDRDIVRRVLPTGLSLDLVEVGEYMTRSPEVLSPEDPILFALNRIVNGDFRHVPLLDDAGRPAGVVSIRDVFNLVIQHFAGPVQNLPPSPSRRSSDYPPHGAA